MTHVEALKPRTQWGLLALATLLWPVLYWGNESAWTWLFARVLHADLKHWGWSAAHYFCADVVKILLLLTLIIFIVTVLRSFMSIERTRALLGGKREGVGNLLASGLGIVTPFCSCSAVPAFIGFVAAGVPLGVTMSFLIASPLINEVAITLLLGLFGPGPTLLYIGSGFVIATVAGWIIGHLKLEKWVEPFVYQINAPVHGGFNPEQLTWLDRMHAGLTEVGTIIKKIWPYLLVGIGLGALIHGWAPADFFARYAGKDNPLGVLVAVVIGVPLYSNAAGILPLVEALHAKGLPMGTLLAFMMAVVALSLPEMIILRRVLKPKLIAVFVGVTATAILATGYLFNAIIGSHM